MDLHIKMDKIYSLLLDTGGLLAQEIRDILGFHNVGDALITMRDNKLITRTKEGLWEITE